MHPSGSGMDKVSESPSNRLFWSSYYRCQKASSGIDQNHEFCFFGVLFLLFHHFVTKL